MPRGAAPRALLGVIALLMAVAVAIVPVVEARPKDKGGKQNEVTADAEPTAVPDDSQSNQGDVVYDETAPVVEQPLTANNGTAVEGDRTLLSLDADGDYLPDALDNCPNVQNPDQTDADGDGHGDACAVYQDTDGDTVPDKSDNCPNIATSDFTDTDGDGIGNSCDKSPDGIEPEPEPVPELGSAEGMGGEEPPPAENGEGLDGQTVEREGRERSKQRERTTTECPIITTDGEGAEEPAEQVQEENPDEPVRDNPRRNEELIAEAAASGELYADPEPPPAAQRAWDEEAVAIEDWESVIRIDAGMTPDAVAPDAQDAEPDDGGGRERGDNGAAPAGDDEVGDSQFARGWVRAKLVLLQEVEPGDEQPEDAGAESDDLEAGDSGDTGGGSAPVPVENGLVIRGADDGNGRNDDEPVDDEPPPDDQADPEPADDPPTDDANEEPGDGGANDEPLDAGSESDPPRARPDGGQQREGRDKGKDGSRRNGSSRGAASSANQRASNQNQSDNADGDNGRNARDKQQRGAPRGWSDDRYYDGGSALNWSGDIGVAGTEDDALYLTQRSGTGPGKKRGFAYAIPVDADGIYLVRLYFAEPYWGAPGGPEGEEGHRIFTVSAEGEAAIEDLDVFAEVGSLTALVKEFEVIVEDGEIDLRFNAREGEPIVAAIEVLQPAE